MKRSERDRIVQCLNIRLPHGWKGDPAFLARQIANQLGEHAGRLNEGQRVEIRLQGQYDGSAQLVSKAFGQRLVKVLARGRSDR